MAVVEQADDFPAAVLNRNQLAFYCVPAQAYEILLDKLVLSAYVFFDRLA